MSNDSMTSVRFPSDVVAELDAMAKEMTEDQPGVKVTRAAVIRMLVMKGLEEQQGKKRRVRAK